jgi:DNA gyrase subunit B
MAQIKKQKNIEFLENEVEAVRTLPDVYIGALGNAGFKNMIREIFQNSLDVIMKQYTLDKRVIVTYESKSHMVIVEDFGPGIPLDVLADVFSKLHSSSNYNKKDGSGEYSAGKNGMGGTITNFLSKYFVVESYREDGTAARVEFHEGVLVDSKPLRGKAKYKKNGLLVSFAPSDMMGVINISDQEIFDMIWLITHLCVIGTEVEFNLIMPNGKKQTTIIKNTGGVSDILGKISNGGFINPIYFTEDNGTMKVEVLLTYDLVANPDVIGESIIMNFANMCPTDGGTHVKGFNTAIIKFFKDYMNKIYLANTKKKLSITNNDIMTGLRAVVSIYHIHGLFEGQAKNVFSKDDMEPYIKDVTLRCLDTWASSNPTDLQKLCKFFKDICELRSKMDGEKIKMSDKFTQSVISGYPKKYKKPNGNKNIEVIITEGDSAASGLENNRDKLTQGIFPIRGKIKNCLTCSAKQFFENEEVAGMFNIFGYKGYEKKFDPAKFRPSKVIIATDADADGKHIECLLMGMFLKYLPFVITEGKLYAANPPLYGLNTKSGVKFFADNREYTAYIQDRFSKEFEVCDSRKKKLSKNDLTSVLGRNLDYVKMVRDLSDTYSINPKVLEFMLYNIDIIGDIKKFKKAIQKQYRFMSVNNVNGVTVINGLYDDNIHNVFCNMILEDPLTAGIVELIKSSENYFYINGKLSTLYDLMYIVDTFVPSDITRYKGLGEMPPKLLGQSTILPGGNRTLKQYTIDDVKKQLEYIKLVQSDKGSFIRGIKDLRRDDII